MLNLHQTDTEYRVNLDADPPSQPSKAAAYWCEMDYFLAHTATGDHPPCRCAAGKGHRDPALYDQGQAP